MIKKLLFWFIILTIIGAIFQYWDYKMKEEKNNSIFYVPNAGNRTLSVIKPKKEEIMDTIALGAKQASHGITLTVDRKRLFTGTGFEGKSLIVVNTETKGTGKKIKFKDVLNGVPINNNGEYL